MLLSLKKQAIKKKNKTNKQPTSKETKTGTTYNGPCLHHRWRSIRQLL